MTKNRAQIIWQEMENNLTSPTFRNLARRAGALLLALGMVLTCTPLAEARRDEPKQSGPINFDARKCGRETVEKRIKGRKEIVAKLETCLLLYNYDPLREDNQERDFGIAWVQARIDPRGAWCATSVWSDLVVDVSKDTRIHKRAPAKHYKIGRSRKIAVKLASFANGSSDEKATLRERITIHPRILRHSRFPFEESSVIRQRWIGQRGRIINLASGVELSWDEEDEGPDTMTSGILSDFERRGRC